jgi:hypothetical protein
MTADEIPSGLSQFEQRARAMLNDSAERLPGSVRSRLTQARYAALQGRAARQSHFMRRWVPAGALAAAALALLIVLVPGGRPTLENPITNSGLEDIELLTDSDAMPLTADQDMDYDFYEWAADEASGAAPSSVGT